MVTIVTQANVHRMISAQVYSHFRGMNGERPLPGKRPGIISTVRNGKHPGHISIFYHFFTSFLGPSSMCAI